MPELARMSTRKPGKGGSLLQQGQGSSCGWRGPGGLRAACVALTILGQ
nr:MAG TPA: hypothetical protein [Caudoviricetes sp.]